MVHTTLLLEYNRISSFKLYLTQRPSLFEVETKGPTIVSYVHVDIDIESAKTTYIRGDYALYED